MSLAQILQPDEEKAAARGLACAWKQHVKRQIKMRIKLQFNCGMGGGAAVEERQRSQF